MQHLTVESFWRSIPLCVARAKELWRDGHVSTPSRVAFEDLLFALKHQASDLRLQRASDLIATLEAFAITVPLNEQAARVADRGIDAGLDMLLALTHPNVSVHVGALYRLLATLALDIARQDQLGREFRPVFVPPRPSRRSSLFVSPE